MSRKGEKKKQENQKSRREKLAVEGLERGGEFLGRVEFGQVRPKESVFIFF